MVCLKWREIFDIYKIVFDIIFPNILPNHNKENVISSPQLLR